MSNFRIFLASVSAIVLFLYGLEAFRFGALLSALPTRFKMLGKSAFYFGFIFIQPRRRELYVETTKIRCSQKCLAERAFRLHERLRSWAGLSIM
jgi:hypothetical protein